jgi:hypothetical protein
MFARRRTDRTPPPAGEAALAEQLAAFRLQYEYLAWRQARGLTPDVEKVTAVDRAVGDLFEGGDYVFPLLHRQLEAAGR